MIGRLLGAFQFLTVVPIPGRTAVPGRAAPFFPLVGAALGATCGLVFKFFQRPLGDSFAALIACFSGNHPERSIA